MKRLIGWLMVVVLVVGVGGLWWVLSYRPLEAGPVFGTVGAAFEHGTGEALDHPLYARVLGYEDGSEFAYYFTVRNAGPLGVTVEGIEDLPVPPEDYEGLVSFVEARVGSATGRVDPGETIPFEPFPLGSGQERLVLLRWRFDGCERVQPGDGFFTSEHTVAYRVMGVGRATRIELPGQWVVVSPAVEDCPGRG